jgi:DNA-binding beta-propeller fold protein YncE
MALAGCSTQSAPIPTPDLFSNVAQQSDQAFAQGMELYQAGRFAEAQAAFNRARLLSPSADPRIDEMIQRTNRELTPTPTEAPPTETPTPAPSPVLASSATPAAEFGSAYFGRSFLAVVPGKNGTAVPMTQFSTQDQLGLYIEKLDERLHLAFNLRVFDADSGAVVGNVTGDKVQRIADNFVWYHSGGEPVGRFHLELFASDVLANTFDYVVGTEPVAIPTPVVVDTPTPPTSVAPPQPGTGVAAPAPPATPVSLAPAAPPVSVAPAAPPPPAPASAPGVASAPPPPPAPAEVVGATRISMPGGPAALAYVEATDALFVADRAGLVWSLQHGQPTLSRPYSVGGEPVGLAADPAGQRVYVAVRGQPSLVVLDAATGKQVTSTALPVEPGDIRLDVALGYLYVVLPQRDALETIDTRDMRTVRVTPGLARVTGIASDEASHTVYMSHLDGRISALDALTGDVTRSWSVSSGGLAGLAIGTNGQVLAVNSSEHALVQLDLSTGEVNRTTLVVEPGAVAVGSQSGALYILGLDANAVVRLDGNDNAEIAREALGDDAPAVASDLGAETAWVRPRMVVSAKDERVYVIEPEAWTLAVSFQ